MSLHFKSVRWQNFLSTGNEFTEIQLDKSPSTLIVGENGAGKSTFLDAISFVLYGKPYRNINKPLLINSITNKNCLVEAELVVKKKHYLIRRGIKPAIFEIYCDGVLIEQNASVREYQEYLEKNVLRLNHKSFTQIIVVGSANFIPFMQLKPGERRNVIEDLLDIEIFSKMYTLLKDRVSKNKDALIESKYQIDLLEQRIDLTKKHMNELMSMQKSDRESKQNRIDELKKQIDEHTVKSQELQEKVNEKSATISDQQQVMKKLEKLNQYEYQLKHKIESIQKDISFLHDNDECPTCQQFIEKDFKDEKIQVKNLKKDEIEDGLNQLSEHYNELNNRMKEITEVQESISELNRLIMNENTSITMCQNNIQDLANKLEEDKEQVNDNSVDELKQLKTNLEQHQKKHEEYVLLKEQYEVASSLLKDGGIKARIIKQYVPIINKLVNKYLASMDFFVQFELDENFNEKIRSRFRDEFTYDSFSEGEKMRIDLALLFTWRAVAKLRNSISTNLLILDEVFDSSLDTTGTDEFLKIITQLSQGTNVFVISHKGDQLYDKFQSNIRFTKVKNFSKIAA